MANLSALRQRIATVETIKKTTHAMRLIAMSNHARLRTEQERIRNYSADVRLLGKTRGHVSETAGVERIIILVASEKGLCGSFNTALFEYCSREIIPQFPHALYIAIGKQAKEYLATLSVRQLPAYEPLTVNRWYGHVDAITRLLMEEYSTAHISVVHNTSKSFFARSMGIYDYRAMPTHESAIIPDLYEIEGDGALLAQQRELLSLKCFLLEHIGESLVAEQAARFMSMDLATRNAETLLETMRLDYNKLRQALITRELTDLTGAL